LGEMPCRGKQWEKKRKRKKLDQQGQENVKREKDQKKPERVGGKGKGLKLLHLKESKVVLGNASRVKLVPGN